jgi:hypothetical protein
MRLRLWLVIGLVFCGACGAAFAASMGDPDVAALQVALHSRGLYEGDIDGWHGPLTAEALKGLKGEQLPRRELGSRLLRQGISGWDVAALQFTLAWHGFPSGPFDGVFGDRVEAAVLTFQEWAGVPTTGQAGPLTLAALRRPVPRCPISLSWPLDAEVGDGFGPRGDRFHAGIDLPVPAGTPVAAAAAGVVIWASWREGGFGNEVVVDHGSGVTTRYDHLSRIDVAVGRSVKTGERLGLVGTTGQSTGPHLHFEVRVRGAAVDPLPALT